jgi:hypothetical protein
MAKAAGEHKHGKPKKPEHVPPRQPFRKRKLPIAALATAAILAAPGAAKAGTVSPQGSHKPSTSEKAYQDNGVSIPRPDFNRSIDGEYAFNGGTASIEFTHTNLETLDAEYLILFSIEGERYAPRFRFNAPPPNALGSATGVFVSEMRTVILTSNYIVVTQGPEDNLENPGTLLMHDGSRLDRDSFSVRLPQELRGGNISSCAATFTPDGDISAVFALSDGKLWSFLPGVEDGSPVSIDVSASGGTSLHGYKGYVFLFQPDSTENFVSVFKRTDAGEISSAGVFRAERSDSAQASADSSAREVPGGMMFSSGSRTLIVLFDGGTNTFTAAASASD